MKLKFTFIIAFFILFQNIGKAQSCSNLFFSEYLEGSSNNKALEIYNPTANTISLSDYIIYRFNNGTPFASDSLLMVGDIVPGGVFVAGNPSSIASILAVSDTLHTITFFNGDDVLLLKQISTQDTLDIIGKVGVDPGVNWPVSTGATSEFTLVRKIDIKMGDVDWTSSANGWDSYPQNTDTYLGSHTMNPCCAPSYSSINFSQCGSYTSPSGITYTSSGVYSDTIPNISGCDSVITINLTINTSFLTQTITLCNGESLTIGTNVYTSNGTYNDTLTNVFGCDSIIETNLSILSPITGSQTLTLCSGQSISVGTNTYTSSGVYNDTLVAVNGCDSLVTTTLTVENAIDITTSVNTVTISSNQTGATYQWLNCDNSNLPIADETNQSFTATANGNYAVVVTVNACSDTSACVTISTVGIKDGHFEPSVKISPNPSEGIFILESPENMLIEVFNSLGEKVYNDVSRSNKTMIDLSNISNGIYHVKISSDSQNSFGKLIKQ